MADPKDPELEGEVDGQEGEAADEGREVAAGEDEDQGDQGDIEAHDEEGQDEGAVEAEPARKPSRAQSRIQSLTQTLAGEKAERQRIDRELADLRAEQRLRSQQAQQETPEAKASRRALMDPLDVMREDLAAAQENTRQMLHQQAMLTQETNDKTTYQGILREAPHLKKYDAEVERIRLEQVAKGVFVPREVILDLAIGRVARAAAMKAGAKPRQQAQQRVAAQQARPAGARGDSATVRGKQGDSPEKRLENVPI